MIPNYTIESHTTYAGRLIFFPLSTEKINKKKCNIKNNLDKNKIGVNKNYI